MGRKSVSVKVPASSGNIGPGFDVLGLALNLFNDISVRVIKGRRGTVVVKVKGEGAEDLSLGKSNLSVRAIEKVFKAKNRRMPALEVSCVNRIPLARGLGSSSAAVVGGLLAGNALLENPFSRKEILGFATSFEGHPDNAAPALFGGVQASRVSGKDIFVSAWPAPRLKAVVVVPEFKLSTKKARQVLPKKIPMKSAVGNLSAVALMGEAFRRHPEWLKDLLNDALHEPYRAKLIPGFKKVKDAALKSGASGVTLSGAGPTILALSRGGAAHKVGKAMVRAFSKSRVKARYHVLTIPKQGAVVR